MNLYYAVTNTLLTDTSITIGVSVTLSAFANFNYNE